MKILYLACHETLENNDISAIRMAGLDVFTTGYFINNISVNPLFSKHLDTVNNMELKNSFDFYHPELKNGTLGSFKINSEWIKNFDCIINCGPYDTFYMNKDIFNGKFLIERSIGLSSEADEIRFKELCLNIIRISPKERLIPGYAGELTVIRPPIDSTYFNGYNGNYPNILTIKAHMKRRAYEAMYSEYIEITDEFKRSRLLAGIENGDIPFALKNLTNDELQTQRQNNRLYLSMPTRTAPLSYSFIEAMMTGMPVVTVGPLLANYPWFEHSDFIENEINGFYSNSIDQIKYYIKSLLNDQKLSIEVGKKGRDFVSQYFDISSISTQWKNIIEQNVR